MYKKWVSIFFLIFLMVTTVVWAKPDSAYIDNGNGTVTDIETKLMWQQATAGEMIWYDAQSYCRGLSLAGYIDWRLPKLHELETLRDLDQSPPRINHMFFPDTRSSFYWSCTNLAHRYIYATTVGFDHDIVTIGKNNRGIYVRAVRGGSFDKFVISPSNRAVSKEAGFTIFSVSNTGIQTMPWTAAVTADSSWLTITYGSSGIDFGIIKCNFTANTSRSSRTGTIRVTAYSAFNTITQKDVTVTQASSIYVDNGNGTVTDTSSSLIWQQATAPNTYNWDQAISYCSGLSLAGYTDWRLPTLDELRTLVDSTQNDPPKINHMFFPGTVSSFYWSSITYAYSTTSAWGVNFLYGNDLMPNKSNSLYVRAVRRGQTGLLGNLAISPLSQMVTQDAGFTTFSVSNTGSGTMPWTAAVTSGDSWLWISNYDSETITCSFTTNTSNTQARSATIQMTTATGATENLIELKVTQCAASTTSAATIDGNLLLNIPHLSYINKTSGTLTFWADFLYEYNPAYPTLILFKLTNADLISNLSFSSVESILSSDFKIHIPDVLLPDGITHLWMDIDYSAALSTDGNAYFAVTNYGVVSN